MEPPGPGTSFHQLAPYIGKMKNTIAAKLVRDYSAPGDWISDPFSGSGTIPLEASIQGRHIIAADCSDYALLLTRAKLYAPPSVESAVERLDASLEVAETQNVDLRTVPQWVRKFFHPETLRHSLRLARVLKDRREDFLLACLLGILHHQRPGFLSYPASHLVPYLRDSLYPRDKFPEMYTFRDVRPRLVRKLERMYKHHQACFPTTTALVRKAQPTDVSIWRPVDAIITSPPYMNALDYVRDNRLRLWFLSGKSAFDHSEESIRSRSGFGLLMKRFVKSAGKMLRAGGYCVAVVGEVTTRSNVLAHPARILMEQAELSSVFDIEACLSDEIPDIRRARREGRATKRELVVVLRRRE